MAARFGVAVLGTGIMGQRMLAALKRHPRFEVLALWDPAPAASQAALALAPNAQVTRHVDGLVQHPGVQLVYIASPPAWHMAGVQAALGAGRAVLCEKPLAHDLADALAIQQMVAASGLPFAVNFPFARSPAAVRLLGLVRSGALGQVADAELTLRFAQWPRPWQHGASLWLAGATEGGFTREVMSHFIFLALRLFGPATVAGARGQRRAGEAETALKARLVHGDATLTIDAAVAGTVDDFNRLALTGSLGQAALTDWARLDYLGQLTERSDSTPHTLDGVADMLAGGNDHGLATVDEALEVVRCVEALLAGC